jgi:hypothetical protein
MRAQIYQLFCLHFHVKALESDERIRLIYHGVVLAQLTPLSEESIQTPVATQKYHEDKEKNGKIQRENEKLDFGYNLMFD